jgi:hypothetical protein
LLIKIAYDNTYAAQGLKPYHHDKYQGGDELSESYERDMLLDLQREAAEDGEDVDDSPEAAKSSIKHDNMLQHYDLYVDTGLDSSDEDTSTIKSPVSHLASSSLTVCLRGLNIETLNSGCRYFLDFIRICTANEASRTLFTVYYSEFGK